MGQKAIIPPQSKNSAIINENVISLTRQFRIDYDQDGIVLVRQSLNLFKHALERNLEGNGLNICIFNDHDKNIIIKSELNTSFKISSIISGQVGNSYESNNLMIYNEHSEYLGWNIAAFTSRNIYFKPLKNFTLNMFLFLLLAILCMLVISYIMSGKIITPIQSLKDEINNMQLNENRNKLVTEDNQIKGRNIELYELRQLYEAFKDMNDRLGISIGEIEIARYREKEYLFKILQSQINPHFIYNTMSIIATVANEYGNTEVYNMSRSFINLLRYINNSTEEYVDIKSEVEYVKSYLQIMKYRFGEQFNYCITIDEKLNHIKIPKLSIQPFIENCFKHGLHKVLPPWEVSVNGYISGSDWYISICDNGAGFPEEKISEINKDISFITTWDITEIQKKSIEKIGVLNTFSRLYLQYGSNIVFEVKSHDIQGSIILLGVRN